MVRHMRPHMHVKPSLRHHVSPMHAIFSCRARICRCITAHTGAGTAWAATAAALLFAGQLPMHSILEGIRPQEHDPSGTCQFQSAD